MMTPFEHRILAAAMLVRRAYLARRPNVHEIRQLTKELLDIVADRSETLAETATTTATTNAEDSDEDGRVILSVNIRTIRELAKELQDIMAAETSATTTPEEKPS